MIYERCDAIHGSDENDEIHGSDENDGNLMKMIWSDVSYV